MHWITITESRNVPNSLLRCLAAVVHLTFLAFYVHIHNCNNHTPWLNLKTSSSHTGEHTLTTFKNQSGTVTVLNPGEVIVTMQSSIHWLSVYPFSLIHLHFISVEMLTLRNDFKEHAFQKLLISFYEQLLKVTIMTKQFVVHYRCQNNYKKCCYFINNRTLLIVETGSINDFNFFLRFPLDSTSIHNWNLKKTIGKLQKEKNLISMI